MNRRTILRGAGVTLALPFLEAVNAAPVTPRRRMVCINIALGLHGPNMIPETSGRDYAMTPYLKLLEKQREQFTILSGVSNPEVGGGHDSYKSFLTTAPHPNSAGFRNSISLDQYAAEELGSETRYASLALSSAGPGLSWSRSGVEVPAYTRPSEVFQKLFLTGKPAEQAEQLRRVRDGQSVLDAVLEKSKSLSKRLTGRDRDKLDQYFEAVREAERRLVKAEDWQKKPKPQVDRKAVRDETDRNKIVEKMRLKYEIMHLALETDSTRFITYNQTGMNSVPVIPGIEIDYHNLSHHGRDPEKIRQLTIVESAIIQEFATFLDKLASSREEGGSLLDNTMVLFGSNLGNASSHDTKNLPVLLAGGGFRHGQHLAFDQTNNAPLPNLYVSMLQRLGLEVDGFGTGKTTMTGLEPV
ncbi:MAG: DUF1552 domain-containing protein [Verrucomicrobiales bacterium]|nr:DUF1552 domain-containing protein [Verrucomicrobiales bacterium]